MRPFPAESKANGRQLLRIRARAELRRTAGRRQRGLDGADGSLGFRRTRLVSCCESVWKADALCSLMRGTDRPAADKIAKQNTVEVQHHEMSRIVMRQIEHSACLESLSAIE